MMLVMHYLNRAIDFILVFFNSDKIEALLPQ
jgi:hypothetical protein